MGDWNSLHFFNEKKFYKELVPMVKGIGNKLDDYFSSELGKAILCDNSTHKQDRINKIINLANQLDGDFKMPLQWLKIANKDKDSYYNSFIRANQNELSDFNNIFELIVFAECALFNPYFELGYRLLIKCLKFKQKQTIAENCINNLSNSYIHNCFGQGIKNWLSHEDVQLLLLDFDKIIVRDEDGINDFAMGLYDFLKIAESHELGVIVGVNLREDTLKNIDNTAIKVQLNQKHNNISNLIWD